MLSPAPCPALRWFNIYLDFFSLFQESALVGTSVLELVLSDRDSPENGPPFSFQITEGNDGEAFDVTQDGLLVTSSVLNRRSKEQYLLQVQVELVCGSQSPSKPEQHRGELEDDQRAVYKGGR